MGFDVYHTCSEGLPEGPLPQAMLPFRHKLVDNTVCACTHVCVRSVHVEYLNMDTYNTCTVHVCFVTV